MLVDFGFAERSSSHSTLSYGTPEYLSPERSKGLPHDTRLSDIWSLGITFFEILVGRTPFERDGEVFETTADLEVYWARSKLGEWLCAGEWEGRMSAGLKNLMRRMIAPDPKGRCSTSQANRDPYWEDPQHPATPPGLPERKIRSKSNLKEAKSKPSLKDVIKAKPSLKDVKPKPSKKDKENKMEETVKAKAKLRKAASATLAKASVVAEPPYSPLEEDLFPMPTPNEKGKQRMSTSPAQVLNGPSTPKPPLIPISTKPNSVPEVFNIASIAPGVMSPKTPGSPSRSAIPIPKRRPGPVYIRDREESDKENASGSDRENAQWHAKRVHVRKPIPSLVREEEGMPAMWMGAEKMDLRRSRVAFPTHRES